MSKFWSLFSRPLLKELGSSTSPRTSYLKFSYRAESPLMKVVEQPKIISLLQAESGGTEKEDKEERILTIFSIVSFSNFACQGKIT